MRLHALQMNSQGRVAVNLQQVEALMSQAELAQGDLLLLPENFALMANKAGYWRIAEHLGEGPIQAWLSAQAKARGIYLVAGSLPIKSNDARGRCYTTSLAYSPQGALLAHYHKLHLFNANIDDARGQYCESACFIAGDKLAYFDINGLRIGMTICFDLRFPSLFALLAQQGCDIVLLPAAFTALTGQAHWQTLVQARAIEQQLYIVAANQCGEHEKGRQTWGQSMIVDPWGQRLDELAHLPGLASAPFCAQRITQVRQSMPLRAHPRAHLSWRD